MWLQAIAERSGKNSDGRQGCLVGRRDMPREFLAWGCGQFSMVAAGRCKKRTDMSGDGAWEWTEEKTVFWAVATPL